MKLSQLIDERLHAALQKLSTEPLPLKTAFKLKGTIKVVKEEFGKYEDVRKEALQRHGQKNEDGSLKINDQGNVQFSAEGIQAFANEVGELTGLDVQVPTLTLAELGDKVTLSASELESLDGIIIE